MPISARVSVQRCSVLGTAFSAADIELLGGSADYLMRMLSRVEGIIPALESSHAIAQVIKLAPKLPKDHLMAVCLSGRGDKDIYTVAKALGVTL